MNALAPDLPDRVDRLGLELRAEIAGLRGEMAELRGEMAELRAEVRTEVRGILPKLIWANLASTFAVAGLVLAAVSIA